MIDMALARHLHELGLGVFRPDTHGGDIFVGWVPDQPDTVVVLTGTGGNPFLGDMKHPNREPTVQVRVRSARGQYVAGALRAQQLHDALHGLGPMVLDQGGAHEVSLRWCRAEQSAPASIGRDAAERPEWTFNLACHVGWPVPA